MGNCFAGVTKEEKKPLKEKEKKAEPPRKEVPKEKTEEPKPPAAVTLAPEPVRATEPVAPPPVQTIPVAPKEAEVIAPSTAANVISEAPNVGIAGLGVDSCLEVYSNSYGAWCPGVIQDMDSTSVFVAYQVPGDPAESLINTKGLPIDSAELRPAADNGAWNGASVEVFSASQKCWCMGRINSIENGIATCIYQYPDAAPESDPIMKQMQLGDQDLQLPGAKNALQYRQGVDNQMVAGVRVEVYSNSMGIWCPGEVQEVRPDGTVSVAFHYPDMDTEEAPVVKELPSGHQDLRIHMPEVINNAPVPEAQLVQGIAVEVYSESRAFWILAHVKEVKDGLVTLLVRYPDMPPESSLFEKVLPVGHVYIRLPEGGTSGEE